MQLDGLTTIQVFFSKNVHGFKFNGDSKKKTQLFSSPSTNFGGLWIPSSSFRRSSAISASKDFKVSAEDSEASRMRWSVINDQPVGSPPIGPKGWKDCSRATRLVKFHCILVTEKHASWSKIIMSYLQSQSSKSFCRCSKKFLASSPSSSSGVCWNSSKTSRTLSAGCNVCQVEAWPELPYWICFLKLGNWETSHEIYRN